MMVYIHWNKREESMESEETRREDADAVEAPPVNEEEAVEGGSVSIGGPSPEAEEAAAEGQPGREVEEDDDEDEG